MLQVLKSKLKVGFVVTRVWLLHPQHSQLGQSEPSEQSAINDNRWSVHADISGWAYSPNSLSHELYRPPMQYDLRFRAVFVFEEACCSSIISLDQLSLSRAWAECGN